MAVNGRSQGITTVEAIRLTATEVVRRHGHALDRRVVLAETNAMLRRHGRGTINKSMLRDLLRGHLVAEHATDQRGRVVGLTLDLPERVALRRSLREAKGQ